MLPGKSQILLLHLSVRVLELQEMRLVETEDGRKGEETIKVFKKSKREEKWVHMRTCKKTYCKMY